MPSLFKSPVYKSHNQVNTTNNTLFASCKTDKNYELNASHTNYHSKEDVLEFESRFESGNLALAASSVSNPREYHLALQRDVNAESLSTQWFYFRVKNNKNKGIFGFNVVNYVKPFSMFRAGMKPCIYSVKAGLGWERAGIKIEYRRNSILYDEDRSYYTLSFSYNFTAADDEVFFAYCYPYTYTRLQRFLDLAEAKHTDKMRRKTIASTIAGTTPIIVDNAVEMVVITNPQYLNKKALYISARVHPGETICSFTCEAIILFLLSYGLF